LPGCSTRDYSR